MGRKGGEGQSLVFGIYRDVGALGWTLDTIASAVILGMESHGVSVRRTMFSSQGFWKHGSDRCVILQV